MAKPLILCGFNRLSLLYHRGKVLQDIFSKYCLNRVNYDISDNPEDLCL